MRRGEPIDQTVQRFAQLIEGEAEASGRVPTRFKISPPRVRRIADQKKTDSQVKTVKPSKTKTLPQSEMEELAIVVLESNQKRRMEMDRLVSERLPSHKILFFEPKGTIIKWLSRLRNKIGVISLGEQDESKGAPVSGKKNLRSNKEMQVVNWLSKQEPFCPVLIHASDRTQRLHLTTVLRLAQWQTAVVLPTADKQWIGNRWLPSIKRAIAKSSARLQSLQNSNRSKSNVKSKADGSKIQKKARTIPKGD